jgi:serine/threonine-protein kinase RsbW
MGVQNLAGMRVRPWYRMGTASAAMAVDTSLVALDSDIRLTLPARPENVAVVRHVLGGLADALRLPDAVVDDMRLAVTEACTNVVRHAYVDEGTIDVVVRPNGNALEIVVSDTGRGIGPSPDTDGPGLGLPLIAALTDSLEVERRRGSGSRLVMRFLPTRTRPAPALGLA